MFGLFKTPTMIEPEEALPGRDEAMQISGTHQVLGTDMQPPFPEGCEQIVFAMGCYWGAERLFWQQEGVHTTAVGFAGGWTPNPTYRESCTGQTGSTEAVLVVYDPDLVSIDQLLKIFWENHDPTQVNRQGNDVGTQYRSGIYWTTEEQRRAVLASKERYQQALHEAGFGDIATELSPLEDAGDGEFYYAEEEHQQYLHKHPNGYCNHGFCQVAYDASEHGQDGPQKVELPDS